MIFTRVVPALLVAAVSAQALYIPDALYTREYEKSRDVAERALDHLNVVRDLASNNEVMVLATRGNEELSLNPGSHHPHGGGEGKTTAERHPVSPGEIKGGQKVHPPGIRLSVSRNWESRWYENNKKKDGNK